MARVADHLDRLSSGDESNAVVDALDAVNLMTVHAAKGLEFPIVFVTNLTRGTGGRGDPIVLVPAGRSGRVLVSVGGNLPDAALAVEERDREETKRLLYVAVTRARERLYLSAVLRNGKFRPGPGSLADVLPQSVRDAFAGAYSAEAGTTVEWHAESGGVHALRVVAAATRDAGGEAAPDSTHLDTASPDPPLSDFAPLADITGGRRVAAAGLAIARADHADTLHEVGTGSGLEASQAALVGTLVHRLFQAAHGRDDIEDGWLESRALAYLSAADEAAGADIGSVVAEATRACRALRSRPDVAALLQDATCHFEVPFSARLAGNDGGTDGGEDVVVRGIIDCLAVGADGCVRVVELKTGRPQPWHQAQLETYVRAARGLCPGVAVEGSLVYLELMQPDR